MNIDARDSKIKRKSSKLNENENSDITTKNFEFA